MRVAGLAREVAAGLLEIRPQFILSDAAGGVEGPG
jgi:hypothetical protein